MSRRKRHIPLHHYFSVQVFCVRSIGCRCVEKVPSAAGTPPSSGLVRPLRREARRGSRRPELSTPAESIDLDAVGVNVATRAGTIRARAAILTVSTAVLAGNAMRLPAALDDWRHAAAVLPLGRNEKIFLEIVGDGPFAPETQVLGNPRDARTGAYYSRPFGWPVIECFFGGDGAGTVEECGPAAGFAYAIDQLATLFGSGKSTSGSVIARAVGPALSTIFIA